MILQMQDGVLDINDEVSMHVDDSSPIYNEVGSQSLPVTLPSTAKNCMLLGWPDRMDSAINVNSPEQEVAVHAGAYHRMGVVNVTEAGPEGITLNVGFDNSVAYSKWKQKKLKDLDGLPMLEFDTVDALLTEMDRLFSSADSQVDDMAVVPVMIEQTDTYERYLNYPKKTDPTKLERVTSYPAMNGSTRIDVDVPEGYGITPSLRVWRVLELVFADLGVAILSNPFKERRDLSRLVILSNVADACCIPTIDYFELLPDVSVETFLQSLFTRFGLVYSVNYSEGTVELRLLSNILNDFPTIDITDRLTERLKVCYDVPKYVRLSASTSLEGAAPAASDWNTFAKDKRLDRCRINKETWATWFEIGEQWESTGFFAWDPQPQGMEAIDIKSDDECVPVSIVILSELDPDSEGRDEHLREVWPLYFVQPDHYNTVMGADAPGSRGDGTVVSGGGSRRGRPTGDAASNPDSVIHGSQATAIGQGSSTHPHTQDNNYRYGSGTDVAGKTPLCYLMAYTSTDVSPGTIGRLGPYKSDGERISFLNQTEDMPIISLVFEFESGHFDLFWKTFDEMCRHSARWIEAKAMMPLHELAEINIIKPIKCNDARCLPDTISYDLTDALTTEATIKLRVMQTQGFYDIGKELQVAPR